MFWFLRGLRRGVVTTRYPEGPPDPWTRSLPTAPAFRTALLTPRLATYLQDVCPSGALAVRGDELVCDLGRCSCCGRCLKAGEGAVVPSGEFLLATRDRADLIQRIPIGDGHARKP